MSPGGPSGRVRAIEAADVYKAGRLAASLTRTADGVEFSYRPDWAGPPVASTLPVGGRRLIRPGGALPAYFANLLPEGKRLAALRRLVKTSADDELSLLLAVGADPVGDVQVVPIGVDPSDVPAELSIDEISAVRFGDVVDDQTGRSALAGMDEIVTAARRNTGRYILKLGAGDQPFLVENESFFLRAARLSGLSVPEFEIVHDVDGRAGLLIQRFDRISSDTGVIRLAVEDGCQATGRPPSDKYRLSTEQTFAALAAVCDAPVVAARDLLRQLAFAYLTGNGNAHAKNFSVRQAKDGEWRVAPAYDLPSSQPYGDTSMAMSIVGRADGDLDIDTFVSLGAVLRVPERAVRRTLTELTERVDLWIDDLLDGLPFDAGKAIRLRRSIAHRRRLLSA